MIDTVPQPDTVQADVELPHAPLGARQDEAVFSGLPRSEPVENEPIADEPIENDPDDAGDESGGVEDIDTDEPERETVEARNGFADLGLSEPILKAVAEMGYLIPTPVQAQAIPFVLMNRDVLGCAQTGTGKTAGFTLPMLDILSGSRARARMPRSLILEPTRELALQVAENFVMYGKYLQLKHALIIGGESMSDQKDLLMRGVDVLIATPGRLIDMFERGGMLLTDCKILVIDEADRMLDMGFIPDVERIVATLPKNRQTLFFSATMAPEVRKLADAFLDNPKEITVSKPATMPTTITTGLVLVAEQDKREALRRLIRSEDVQNALIFCNRKRDVDILYKSLSRHGFSVGALHGDMAQPVRFATLEKFKNNEIRLLCCSDVAARGLDIGGLSHVFNFDVPIHAEDFVHRIGRTGRAGRAGDAITLVTPREQRLLHMIERAIGKRLTRMKLPSPSDIASRRREAVMDRIRAAIDEGELGQYLPIVEALGDEYDPVDIAAAAFKVLGDGTLMRAEETGRDEGDDAGVEPGMTRLFIHAGRRAGIRPMDIVGAIANEANLPGNRVGSIDLYDNFSFVEVPNPDAPRVMQALNNTTLRGRKVEVNVAKPKR